MQSIPFYLDWTFWAVIVAALALVLSQLPPLVELFKKTCIDVECFSVISLTHTMGNPNATLYLSLQNIGGKEVKVDSIKLKFTHEDGDSFSTPGQTYFPKVDSKESVIMPPFRIKPQEAWEHSILFFNRFNRDDDKLYRSIREGLRLNIADKKLIEGSDAYVQADENLVSPAIDFFQKRNKWKSGEYSLEVEVETKPNKVAILKKYRFTLFESDINTLERYTDDYKYGLGVFYYDSGFHPGIVVTLIQN